MLEREFKYYRDHQEELVKLYNGNTIVIIGEDVVGVYPTFEEALSASQRKYEPGTYLIQVCAPGEDNYTHTFHTRAVFV